MRDTLDLSTVQIVSSPDVRSWPITTEITELGIHPSVLHIRYDKQGQWPPVDIGGALQEATVWIFLQINGEWHATGAERLRPNQTDKPEDVAVSNFIGTSWLYDPHRWGPMAGYVPKVGELVGFMVAAGSTRSDDHVNVRERSAVVLVRWPDAQGADYPPFVTSPEPQPEPLRREVVPTPNDASAAAVALAKLDAIHDAIVKQTEQQHKDAETLLTLLQRVVPR